DKAVGGGCLGRGGGGVGRVLGVAGGEGDHPETAPAEYLLGGRQAGLAPAAVDLGGVVTAVDRDVGKRRAHRIGDRRRQPLTHLDGASRRGDRRQGLRQDDAGVA